MQIRDEYLAHIARTWTLPGRPPADAEEAAKLEARHCLADALGWMDQQRKAQLRQRLPSEMHAPAK